MKRGILAAVAAMALLAIGVVASGNKPENKAVSDGPTIFIEKKCNNCHAIEEMGMKKTSTSTSNQAPDLSDVGNRRDAQWLAKYLQKDETINGKKHTMAFRGDDTQLAEITTWLSTLKGKQGKGAGE